MSDEPLLRRLFDLSEPQDGCIAASQIVDAGITYDTIESLVERGMLTRVLQGVYVVGARTLSDRQFKWAALLAAGPGSALSHWTAAAMHGMVEANPAEVWVTAPRRRGGRTISTLVPVAATDRPGTIRIVSAASGRADGLLDNQVIVGAAEALVGVAGVIGKADPSTVLKAWHEADYRNKLRLHEISAVTGRGVAGSKLVREFLRAHPIVSDDQTDVATPEEFALLAAVLRIGLPRPRTNQLLRLPGGIYFPDLWWIAVGLVVEVDGGIHKRHGRRAADRARDLHMQQHGLSVMRFDNAAVDADADACAAKIAELHADLSRR